MTEQEAEVLAARLARVWGPIDSNTQVNFLNEDVETGFEWLVEFQYHADLVAETKLEVVLGDSMRRSYRYCALFRDGAVLSCDDGVHDPWTQPEFIEDSWEEKQQKFASEWMGLFRRNCWLSGFDIEASAHEKAEWIQGFSREELESWNIKI